MADEDAAFKASARRVGVKGPQLACWRRVNWAVVVAEHLLGSFGSRAKASGPSIAASVLASCQVTRERGRNKEGPLSQMTQTDDSTEKPSLAALLKRALEDDEDLSSSEDRERYVRDDEDGYSG